MNLNVPDLVAPMLATHRSGKNLSLKWRLTQLNALLLMITECEEDIADALYEDLHKEKTEALSTEILVVKNEIIRFQKELKGWMVPEQVPTPAVCAPSFCEIKRVPLSEPACLIIGPFNFPFSLPFLAAVGAFGGGNPVVMKPSDYCNAVSSTIAKLVPKYFDKGAMQIVQGGIPETTELLKYHWGMIHFTGSETVGKIIQQSAAKTLSPTILELGGKSPTIVAEDCPDDMAVVCNRIIQGKLMNVGQVCVSPDYILCHESKLSSFLENAIAAIERQFTKNQKDSELGRIIHKTHAERLVNIIEEVERMDSSSVVYGGSNACSVSEKYVAPTIMVNPPESCRVLNEEIFGPIMPIVTYCDDEEAIAISRKKYGTPLALYVFTKSNLRYEKFMARLPSGMAMRNDVCLHILIPDFPFNGLGTSGMGKYTGKASFDSFSHDKASQYHPCHAAFEFCGMRYHPYKGLRGKLIVFAFKYAPSIPVISTRMKVFFTIAFACLVLVLKGPNAVALNIADFLETTALFLRKQAI